MRSMRILASVVVVVALGAITAAQASAAPAFHAEKYPVHISGAALNNQGFEGTGVASNCTEATASTGEEKAVDPTKDATTLEVHPIYKNCILTLLGVTSGPANVITTGCNYVFHVAKPGSTEGSTDIKCEAGKAIKIEATFLPNCVITVNPQLGLKSIEYLNEPTGPSPAPEKVEIRAEVEKIKTQIAEQCGTGKLETTSEYREGEVSGGNAKLAAKGKPAKFLSKGTLSPGDVEADPIEVALNEPHWYENHVALGTGEAAAEQALMWGKLVFTDAGAGIGTAECATEWGGKVYNPQGVGGVAIPGEGKISAFQAYNCTSTVCEATDASKLSVAPEGLGVLVEGSVAKFGEWEAKLTPGPTRLHIGNKTSGSATQIKLHVLCPKTTGAEYNKKWKGELAPELENGTAIGSAPTKLTFNSGELEVEAVTEGKVSNKLKMMGYEGGEIVSTKAP